MRTVTFDEQITVTIHNKREQILYDIMLNQIDNCKSYKESNAFGDRTNSIIEEQNMVTINGILTSMYFMDMIKEAFSVDDITWFRKNHLYHK